MKAKTRTSSIGSSPRSNQIGLTLLELLLVMLILTVFSSVLFLRLGGPLSGGDLSLAGRMIVNEINRARGEAAYAHQDRFLRFNLEEDRIYMLEAKKPVKEGSQQGEEPLRSLKELPKGVVLEDVVIGSKEKVQEGEVDIRFFANGSMDRAIIHIRDEENRVLTLILNPITGQVEIKEGYLDERLS